MARDDPGAPGVMFSSATVGVKGRRVAVAVLVIEGAVLSLTALLMLTGLVLEFGHLASCPKYNVDSPCGFADRLPRDALLTGGALAAALAVLWAARRLVRWSRAAWGVGVLAQFILLAFIAGSTDKFGAFAAPFLGTLLVAAVGLAGLGVCASLTFGSRSAASNTRL